ncbi:RES family NAD+ phosphorylase [Aquibium sp. LZ166]|uniref:RES family NAD+ phosphorylase n=1 Tax=Aquibium pacificus TaxID=3153579 RepID=A0ABV3SLZ4_9HYPH
MSSATWTPGALLSEAVPLEGTCWRLVEAQHRVSTMKLTDTLDEQAVLETELERTKPPVPPECAGLHYLLSTPFRYGRYPGNSRFRREGFSPGVYYAAEQIETAVAETAFYRLLFFAESPATPWPANPLEFTAFEATHSTARSIDLLSSPFLTHADAWTRLTDYSACLALADRAREAGVEIIRYASVRDPDGRPNLAILTCRAFARPEPLRKSTWRLALSAHGAKALCDWPAVRMDLPIAVFAADPRLAAAR